MEGLKYKDIAEALDISIKTVESQMRIAFTKISDEYTDDFVLFLVATVSYTHLDVYKRQTFNSALLQISLHC